MYLNHRKKVIGVYRLSKGGITGTVADIRLVLSVALKTLATSIVIAHNHPSGNLTASICDKNLTSTVKDALKLIDVTLLDHLIITNSGYLSFSDEGLM